MPTAAISAPWWRHGHVWLVIAGPAVVVVASALTLWLALRQPDPVVANDPPRGLRVDQAAHQTSPQTAAQTLTAGQALKAHMPAVQARNHAASPPPEVAPSLVQPPGPPPGRGAWP